MLVCLAAGAALGALAVPRILQGQGQPPPQPPPMPRELTSYREVVKRVLPAVVSIEVRSLDPQSRPGRRPAEPPREGEPLDFGSGFIIDPRGGVVTSWHVVEGAREIEVLLADGRRLPSRDVRSDPRTDVAVIRVEAGGPLPALEWGDSSAMEIGDRVLAVGAPFGLAGSVTAGIVSGKGRSLRVNQYEDFLQTDAAINPGNSGGPLVNLEGKVVGITSAIKSRSGGFQGVGLAISSNLARGVARQLYETGAVKRGFLGAQVQDVDRPEVAAKLGLRDGGVVVTHVYDGGPAAKAGLKPGDVLVAVGRRGVRDSRDLQAVILEQELDKPVEALVWRDGQAVAMAVTITEQPADFVPPRLPRPRPPDARNAVAVERTGFDGLDLNAETASALGLPEGSRGVVVARVARAGPAARAGLRPGMVIVRVEGKPVESVSALRELLTPEALARGVLLQVQSALGGTNYSVLRGDGN
jgi:serine protease Do